MDADLRFENKDGDETPEAKKQAAPASGATDIFGTFSPEVTMAPPPTGAWETVPAGAADAGSGAITVPVVHEVVFKSDVAPVVQAPVVVPAPVLPPVAPIQNGGFTQLLRALNYEQLNKPELVKAELVAPVVVAAAIEVAPVVVTPPPSPIGTAPVVGSSLTELLRAFEAPKAAARVEVSPVSEQARGMQAPAPVAASAVVPPVTFSAQVTSFGPAGVKTGVPDAASFTQMFQALDTKAEVRTNEAPVLAAGGVTQTLQVLHVPDAPAVVNPPAVAPPAVVGAFTQMFRTLDAAPVPAKPEPVKESEVFTPLVPPVAEAAGPGEFTRMFSTIVSEPIAESKSAESGPGSFTQMFRSLEGQSLVQTPSAAYVAPAQPLPPQTGGGTFTQMFRTLDGTKEEASPPKQDAGSFTQMFGTAGEAAHPTLPQASPVESGSGFGMGGASQAFGTYRPEETFPAPVRPELPTTAARGGLTQLLRTLDAPVQPMDQAAPRAVESAAAAQQPGSFTSVYGKLEGYPPVTAAPAEPPAMYVPPVAAASPVAPPSMGPSEFTRLIHASQLRESALRGGEAAAGGAAPAAGGVQGVMSAPAMPAVPQTPHWGAPSGGAPPAAPAMPAIPAVPQVKLPEAPKVAAPVGMQQYLPLLLIIVIFLLLALLVAVFFLMKK